MLNNKGQSLVLFVIMLPILLLILILVIDIGKVITLKQELDNINNLVLDYGIDNIDKDNIEEELYNIIDLNNNEIDVVQIEIEDNKIYVLLSDSIDGMFSKFINISVFEVESYYIGYMEDNVKKIESVGD